MRKLSIGGYRPGPDWLCVDPYDPRAQVRRPAWDTGLNDGQFDWIEIIHCLEHIPIRLVIPTLQEIGRLLTPDGSAAIMTPDVRRAMRAFLQTPSFPPPGAIWGNQVREGMEHRCGFAPSTLKKVVEAAGLSCVSVEEVEKDCRTLLQGGDTPYRERFLVLTRGIRPGILAHARRK